MNTLCWNCRGMGNPWSVRQLRRWSHTYAPDIIFLSETMIKKNVVKALKDKLSFHNAFGVSSVGKAGVLCIFWREEIKFSLVSYSQNHISGDIEDGDKKWRFVGIYGWPKEEDKYKTWNLIRHLHADSEIPILFGGDFNEILCSDEKEGGVDRHRRAMDSFRETMDDLALCDLGSSGPWFTWERGNTAATKIRERLDRYLGSSTWVDMFPDVRVENLLRYKSDHSPIVTRCHVYNQRGRKGRGFRFETNWLLDETCEAFVQKTWDDSVGSGLFSRFEMLGRGLLVWSKEKFGKLNFSNHQD